MRKYLHREENACDVIDEHPDQSELGADLPANMGGIVLSARKGSGALAVTGQLLIYDTQTATICLGLALLITVTACGGGAQSYNGGKISNSVEEVVVRMYESGTEAAAETG